MTKKRKITNEEFNKALRNEDYIRIINAASKKYASFISPDDMLECRMNALWQSLQNFDASFGVKFTSFLYSRVVWECKKKINVVNKPSMTIDRYTGVIAMKGFGTTFDGQCEKVDLTEKKF